MQQPKASQNQQLYPTYPYPPISHQHFSFELPSPEFEPIDAPIVVEANVPEEVLKSIDESMLLSKTMTAQSTKPLGETRKVSNAKAIIEVEDSPCFGWIEVTNEEAQAVVRHEVTTNDNGSLNDILAENKMEEGEISGTECNYEPIYEDITPGSSPIYIDDELMEEVISNVLWAIDVPDIPMPRSQSDPPPNREEEAIDEVLYAELEENQVQQQNHSPELRSPASPPRCQPDNPGRPQILEMIHIPAPDPDLPLRQVNDRLFLLAGWCALRTIPIRVDIFPRIGSRRTVNIGLNFDVWLSHSMVTQ